MSQDNSIEKKLMININEIAKIKEKYKSRYLIA
jgi:hypothetical protein